METNHIQTHRRRAIGPWLLLLTFTCGGIVGGVVGASVMRSRITAILTNPEGLGDYVIPRIQSEIGLTDEQIRSIEPAIRRRHIAMQAVRAESHSLILANLHGLQTEVAKFLPEDKAAQWLKFSKHSESKFVPRAPAPPETQVLFKLFDANKDASLAQKEVPPGMWLFLQRADRNSDGVISRDEYEQVRGEKFLKN